MRKEGKNKGKVKHYSFPKIILFGCIFKKKSTHPLLVHGYFSWSTFGLHLVRGANALKMHFFRNWTMEV